MEAHTTHNRPLPSGTKAMLFAAGLGTRLRPFTEHHPKALMPVNGKTLLERNLRYLASFGIEKVIINVHHFADQIKALLTEQDGFGMDYTLSHEDPAPLETGGGLMKAAWFFEGDSLPFVLMNADILTNLNLAWIYQQHLSRADLATLAVTSRSSSRALLFDRDMRLSGWENRKTGEQKIVRGSLEDLQALAFSGVHIIQPNLLQLVRQQGVFSIIDTYLSLAAGHQIGGCLHDGDLVVDVGRPESVLEAEKYFH